MRALGMGPLCHYTFYLLATYGQAVDSYTLLTTCGQQDKLNTFIPFQPVQRGSF